ncbi:hypothetical protein SAMN05421823_12114 [Catalinimonas alkaloidigena]|uniref:Lipocalin-like domain-containing protein n=1 Tax=Catalinimonas alkaloidigena TaxID=1075417 RepID=A0A1G9VJY2_9BACT|nr:hypothetical protein [Catalinimonas alkaloidigena]SDM72341.1 hypothetical protein SAMN05421823_12114 [Catalinimonas alkaloidigena]
MKTKPSVLNALLLLPLLGLACHPEDPRWSPDELWACHQAHSWDALQTRHTLLGEWIWEQRRCVWHPKEANREAFGGLHLVFKADSTLEVQENGQVLQVSRWQVVPGDAGLFALQVDPAIAQLSGRILFCEDRVVFQDSYRDGCDHYFKRKE